MANLIRSFNRQLNELRPVTIEVGVNRYAEGSCLISFGHTKVLCTASVEKGVPPFLKGKGQGWVTAEYALLPRATDTRVKRERDKVGGRTAEIQRLIGRAVRAAIEFKLLGEQTIILDCDVLQADGGTRTASVTGAYVALALAVARMRKQSGLQVDPMAEAIAAVSVGICNGQHVLDLDYKEDSTSEVDMNFVMTGSGKLVEVQGTAETKPFSSEDLVKLTDLAGKGIAKLLEIQRTAIAQGLKMM